MIKHNPNDVAKLIHTKLKDWPGNCYGIASLCLQHGVVQGKLRYGHWHGFIHKKSIFSKMIPLGFAQHGWVELDNKEIFDPTRYVFENVEPYIYVGKNDFYDVGGNLYRELNRQIPPRIKSTDQMIDVVFENDLVKNFVKQLLNDHTIGNSYSIDQIFWLANSTPKEMQMFGKEIFLALQKADFKAFIPIDNWRLIME